MLNTSTNGNDSMAIGIVCVRGIQLTAALNCCLFLKVISLKVDEIKLIATSSDILMCYLVISERFSISAMKCILYFNYYTTLPLSELVTRHAQ